MPSSMVLAASQRRACAIIPPAPENGTRLGAYLEACGAIWGAAMEEHEVVAAADGRSFTWRLDLPPERLASLRPGDPIESSPFELDEQGLRGRFLVFPKGDAESSDAGGFVSLWLCTDSCRAIPVRLRLGSIERDGGASDFGRLDEVIRDDVLEVGLRLEAMDVLPSAQKPAVQQSLQLTGLQLAEWRLFDAEKLFEGAVPVSSPPFRFHHVLLGDMYLEFVPGVPHAEHCAIFFRCRVPTMRLRVQLEVGSGAFSKSIEVSGKTSWEKDLSEGRCLPVNFSAPKVLEQDGSLAVRVSLEEVVALPPTLHDMIPGFDKRALWPKRL